MLSFWAGLSWRVSSPRLLSTPPPGLSDGYTSTATGPSAGHTPSYGPSRACRSHSAQKRPIRDEPRWLARRFYPQIWINYKRKSTTGLSMDFLCLNPIGALPYSFP